MRTESDGTITYFPLDHPQSEVAVAWYLEMFPEPTGNVMAMVFRDGPDKLWKLVVRSRIYVDDEIGDKSKDRRTGMMVEAKPGSDPATARHELVNHADDILGGLMSIGMGRLYRQSDHTSLRDFFDKWGMQPWANLRERAITPEELDRLRERERAQP